MNSVSKKSKVFIRNLAYAFLAQGLSLGLSVVMSLMIPKILGVEEYGYWQLFIFYISYAGFFHLGLTDGIYLRNGGKNYRELNYPLLGGQMKCLFLFQALVGVAIALLAPEFVEGKERIFVIQTFCVYMVTYNAVAYLGYIFQAVNQTKKYSTAIIIEKLLCLICIMVLVLVKVESFAPYILAYLVCDVIALGYCISNGREIVLSGFCEISALKRELWTNIKVGSKLLTANLSSLLIVGLCRVMVDQKWGIREFSKFSLAISLTNFFLVFISQISMVMFPALRQAKEGQIKELYIVIKRILSFLLPAILIFYFPMQWILSIWLPKYTESFRYLALLLPICTFDGKMQLLSNTYFKVLRKENILLAVNIFAMITSGAMGFVGTFLVGNIYVTIIAIVVAIGVRSIVSDIYLGKMMQIKTGKDLCLECALAAIFMITAWMLPAFWACVIYLCAYVGSVLIKKQDVEELIKMVRNKKEVRSY